MDAERRAEIERDHPSHAPGHAPCTLCDVLAALREAEQEPVITMTDGRNIKLGEVADAYDALQRQVEALEPCRKFWEAFWEELIEQEFGYVNMDCEELVTERAVALGLVQAVPFDPAKHGEDITGEAEPGDIIYMKAAPRGSEKSE